MLAPVLLIGAAAVGAWYLLRDESNEASTQPPETVPPAPPSDVVNVAATRQDAQLAFGAKETTLWVYLFVPGYPNAGVVYRFENLDDAKAYYDQLVQYMDTIGNSVICEKGGVGLVQLWGFLPGAYYPDTVLEKWYHCDWGRVNQSVQQSASAPPASTTGKPAYLVNYVISGQADANETVVVRTDAEADLYYRLLRAYFEQPAIHQGYTSPKGLIALTKLGPTGQNKSSLWMDGVELV